MKPTLIQPYLFFGGRCEEAIAFYTATLGATVEMIMRYHEAPDAPPPGVLAEGYENKIMHTSLRIGDHVIMASDGCGEALEFSGFSLSLSFATEEEARKAFDGLSEGGTVLMPLGKTFWSPLFGMTSDRFGVSWMITINA